MWSLLQPGEIVTDIERREELHNLSSLLKKEVKARQIVSVHRGAPGSIVARSVKTQKQDSIRAPFLLLTPVFSMRWLLPCGNTLRLASGNQVLDADVLDDKR